MLKCFHFLLLSLSLISIISVISIYMFKRYNYDGILRIVSFLPTYLKSIHFDLLCLMIAKDSGFIYPNSAYHNHLLLNSQNGDVFLP